MSTYYWDTSAAINAVVSPEVRRRLSADHHTTRVPTFSEFFAVMTGRGIRIMDPDGIPVRFQMSPKDAAAWLRGFCEQVRTVELDADETLSALALAEKQGVQGGRVYDYVHALVADKAKADAILTRNTDDFTGLSSRSVEWP